MCRKSIEMPFFLALAASAVIHAAALLGPGWELPALGDAEPLPTIDAVLAKPAPRSEAAPAAKPAAKAPVDKPRRLVSPANLDAAPVVAAAAAQPAPAVESPPVAASPAPTLAPAAPVPVRIALPGKGRMRYTITRGEGGFVVGQATHTWEQDGFAYKLQSVTETTGLAAVFKPARVVQSSQGEVTAEGLRPLEFRHERVGATDTASFDWLRGVVRYGGREDGVAAGAQDMLSMYYQLVLLAPKSGVLEMSIATGRKLENYRIEVLGEETVALPTGERQASRLRIRSGGDTIELWLAVGKDADTRGMPLKIRFTDRKGEIFDQLAADIDPREPQ
jgi:hypothetical protein